MSNFLEIHNTDQDGKQFYLKDFLGQKVVLYFYPKDSTPGCTTEALDFTRLKQQFADNNAVIFGVSKDSVKSHKKFHDNQCLAISLISDENGELVEAFDVWKEKSMYGKKYMGIERSTFIINTNGQLIKEMRNVSVKGHAEEVLSIIKSI